MSIFTKTLIITAAALLSTGTASAQSERSFDFRYDPSASVEKNYDGFKRTAHRACDGLSSFMSFGEKRECRKSLVSEAVAATKLGSFIAYHASRSGEVGETAALARR